MQLKVLYWFIVTIKLCLCEHFAMVHPLAKSPSSLQFYSAPFQASAEHVTENASPIPNGFFSTVNKFDEGKDTSTSTPFLPHPVELESHHSARNASDDEEQKQEQHIKDHKEKFSGSSSNHNDNEKKIENAKKHETDDRDEASNFKKLHKEKKGHKSAKFGEKKGHKKGHKTKGYNNKFHKDEYHREHKIYDDPYKSGYHSKHGAGDDKYQKSNAGHRSGYRHNDDYQEENQGKKYDDNKGRLDNHHKEHKKKTGYQKFHKVDQNGKSIGFSKNG